jgi:hypothetical protein
MVDVSSLLAEINSPFDSMPFVSDILGLTLADYLILKS